ncbi:hypothetical protein [Gluconobacter kanchanaburiensis]|uniref:hypothetical protein n=1 Tax=Gluconobacter kanchanaburiensis TaxID=563199 RepID=UPI00142E9A94|nr:hypothetical protein [Gluconobacter kanchanaburiensis]MBF0860838.1 hypothetical protein [Gluconobacter kanchanaburiensis]
MSGLSGLPAEPQIMRGQAPDEACHAIHRIACPCPPLTGDLMWQRRRGMTIVPSGQRRGSGPGGGG